MKLFGGMLSRALWALFVLGLFGPLVVAKAGNGCAFKAIFNFGDSNSDTGGFWAAFPAQSGPFGMTYFHRPTGRACDGRLVVDFLAQALGLPFLSPYLKSVGSDFRHGANFATLASTVLLPNTSLFVSGISPFSLAIQLNQMKELKSLALRNPNPDAWQLPPVDVFSSALFTIDIGQNDFTHDLSTSVAGGIRHLLPIINKIAWTIKDLYDFGGRTFLVFNLAPVGCYPAFITSAAQHLKSDLDANRCMSTVNQAVDDYNRELEHALQRTRSMLPGATVIYIDTHAAKLELIRNPRAHGFEHATRACCGHGGGAYNYDPRLYCGNVRVVDDKEERAAACANPWRYVSWDGIHLTEAANQAVAAAVLNGMLSRPPFALARLCKKRPF